MAVLDVILSALIPVVGGMFVAAILCFAAWNLMKLVRHPEFGPTLALCVLGLLLAAGARMDQVLAMASAFLVVPAFMLWPEGTRWRRRHP